MREKPIFFISSPYAKQSTQEVLGQAAYSHKILAEKIVIFLKEAFSVHYVVDQKDLENHLILSKSKIKNYFIYVGPPDFSWTSPKCRNYLLLTWEFPDIPSESIKGFYNNWIPKLRKFEMVILPNRILHHKLNELDIPNEFFPIGRSITQSVDMNLSQSLDILANQDCVVMNHQMTNNSPKGVNSHLKLKFLTKTIDFATRYYFKLECDKFLPEFLRLNLRKIYREKLSNLLLRTYNKSYFRTVDSLALEIYGKTVVSSWLNVSDNRKNFELLIKAYTQASRLNSNSTLMIKIIGHSSELEKAKLILSNLQDRFPNKLPPIILIHGSLEDSTMYALRNATDIYLNTSSTEGICLPALEHAIHGVKVVLPRNSAFLDYFSDRSANFYEVDCLPTHFPGDPSEKLQTSWNPPLFKDLVEVLKVSIENSHLDRKRIDRSRVQQKLKVDSKQFVRELRERNGSR
jgi:hypothetical protein